MRAARRLILATAVVMAGLAGVQGAAIGQAATGRNDSESVSAGAVNPGTPTVQPVSLEGPTTAGGTTVSGGSGGGGSSGGGSSAPSPYTYERKYEYKASSGAGFLCPPVEGEPPGRVYQDVRTNKETGETTVVASGCERPSTPGTPAPATGSGSGTAPPPPSPGALAVQALNRTPLPAPSMAMSPGGSIPLLVNLPTYLWIDPAQWRPVTASASAGAVTSTVTATPERVVWDMGQGETVTCDGPGSPYVPSLSDAAQPSDCKFSYRASSARSSDKTFTVTATVEWHVTWSASGAAGGGDLGISRRSSTTTVRVAELQVLNTASRP